MKLLLSALQSFSGPATYSILADLFPKEKRTKSFFVYSILTQLGDTVSLLTLNLCNIVGWRMSYKICGGFGICTAIVGIIMVREPPREILE